MFTKPLSLALLAGLTVFGVGVPTCGEPTPEPALTWYTTCGAPVCSGYHGPYTGVPACTTETEGAACTTDGATCDFHSDCDALLVCAAEDPKDDPEGCPRSAARYKSNIHPLDDADLKALHRQLIDMPLATWHYTAQGENAPKRLGFIIEEQAPGNLAVREPQDMVDVYGFTSMTAAAVKVQQAEIDALRQEIAALRAQVDAGAAVKTCR